MEKDKEKRVEAKKTPPTIYQVFPVPAGEHLPYGSFIGFPPPFDFRDANIGLIDFGSTSIEKEWLNKIWATDNACASNYSRPLEEIVKNILKQETKFDLDKYDLYIASTGARGSLMEITSKLINSKKNLVAYPSPNWIFDKIVAGVPGAVSLPFHANSAEKFVQNFAQLQELDKVATVIIVDPANPLGYRFNEAQINSIETIAEKHGIIPMFDDVFRGMQVKGERHSSSEYSKNSIIVETTSKRFGARGLGVTWSLIPKSLTLDQNPQLSIDCKGCSAIAASVTEGLYESSYGDKISQTITARSEAFMRGVKESFLGENYGRFIQAFPSMPIIIYLPPRGRYAEIFALYETLARKIGVSSGLNWICGQSSRKVSDDEIEEGIAYLRICPTKEPADRSYVAGLVFGAEINGARIKID